MIIQSPSIIQGACHKDERGELRYNNNFDTSPVKRLYIIQNSEADPLRGWQGHKIEQRWFIAVSGTFEIYTITIDDWKEPSKDLTPQKFVLAHEALDTLHVPAGHITAIKAIEPLSMALVMSDYRLGEIKDEYRFSLDYFKNIF